MSVTLKISNGQLDFDAATGQVNTVSGNRKAAQDMAECLMQEYLQEQDYGSFLRAILTNKVPFTGDLFIRYYIAQAVQKLQALQQVDPELTESERIDDILDLLTADDGAGNVAFYVNVSTGDGGTADAAASRRVETQLNHQFERFEDGSQN